MAGVLSRAPRVVGSSIRTGWLLLGVILILIVLCEAGLRLALTARDRLLDLQTAHRMVEVRAGVDAYQGAAWIREYTRELDTSYRFVWQSYVYWRRSPYQGRYVNT